MDCAPFPGTKLYEQMKTRLDEATLKTYTAYDGGQDTIMKASKKNVSSHVETWS